MDNLYSLNYLGRDDRNDIQDQQGCLIFYGHIENTLFNNLSLQC